MDDPIQMHCEWGIQSLGGSYSSATTLCHARGAISVTLVITEGPFHKILEMITCAPVRRWT